MGSLPFGNIDGTESRLCLRNADGGFFVKSNWWEFVPYPGVADPFHVLVDEGLKCSRPPHLYSFCSKYSGNH
jgi:hypothetical protein